MVDKIRGSGTKLFGHVNNKTDSKGKVGSFLIKKGKEAVKKTFFKNYKSLDLSQNARNKDLTEDLLVKITHDRDRDGGGGGSNRDSDTDSNSDTESITSEDLEELDALDTLSVDSDESDIPPLSLDGPSTSSARVFSEYRGQDNQRTVALDDYHSSTAVGAEHANIASTPLDEDNAIMAQSAQQTDQLDTVSLRESGDTQSTEQADQLDTVSLGKSDEIQSTEQTDQLDTVSLREAEADATENIDSVSPNISKTKISQEESSQANINEQWADTFKKLGEIARDNDKFIGSYHLNQNAEENVKNNLETHVQSKMMQQLRALLPQDLASTANPMNILLDGILKTDVENDQRIEYIDTLINILNKANDSVTAIEIMKTLGVPPELLTGVNNPQSVIIGLVLDKAAKTIGIDSSAINENNWQDVVQSFYSSEIGRNAKDFLDQFHDKVVRQGEGRSWFNWSLNMEADVFSSVFNKHQPLCDALLKDAVKDICNSSTFIDDGKGRQSEWHAFTQENVVNKAATKQMQIDLLTSSDRLFTNTSDKNNIYGLFSSVGNVQNNPVNSADPLLYELATGLKAAGDLIGKLNLKDRKTPVFGSKESIYDYMERSLTIKDKESRENKLHIEAVNNIVSNLFSKNKGTTKLSIDKLNQIMAFLDNADNRKLIAEMVGIDKKDAKGFERTLYSCLLQAKNTYQLSNTRQVVTTNFHSDSASLQDFINNQLEGEANQDKLYGSNTRQLTQLLDAQHTIKKYPATNKRTASDFKSFLESKKTLEEFGLNPKNNYNTSRKSLSLFKDYDEQIASQQMEAMNQISDLNELMSNKKNEVMDIISNKDLTAREKDSKIKEINGAYDKEAESIRGNIDQAIDQVESNMSMLTDSLKSLSNTSSVKDWFMKVNDVLSDVPNIEEYTNKIIDSVNNNQKPEAADVEKLAAAIADTQLVTSITKQYARSATNDLGGLAALKLESINLQLKEINDSELIDQHLDPQKVYSEEYQLRKKNLIAEKAAIMQVSPASAALNKAAEWAESTLNNSLDLLLKNDVTKSMLGLEEHPFYNELKTDNAVLNGTYDSNTFDTNSATYKDGKFAFDELIGAGTLINDKSIAAEPEPSVAAKTPEAPKPPPPPATPEAQPKAPGSDRGDVVINFNPTITTTASPVINANPTITTSPTITTGDSSHVTSALPSMPKTTGNITDFTSPATANIPRSYETAETQSTTSSADVQTNTETDTDDAAFDVGSQTDISAQSKEDETLLYTQTPSSIANAPQMGETIPLDKGRARLLTPDDATSIDSTPEESLEPEPPSVAPTPRKKVEFSTDTIDRDRNIPNSRPLENIAQPTRTAAVVQGTLDKIASEKPVLRGTYFSVMEKMAVASEGLMAAQSAHQFIANKRKDPNASPKDKYALRYNLNLAPDTLEKLGISNDANSKKSTYEWNNILKGIEEKANQEMEKQLRIFNDINADKTSRAYSDQNHITYIKELIFGTNTIRLTGDELERSNAIRAHFPTGGLTKVTEFDELRSLDIKEKTLVLLASLEEVSKRQNNTEFSSWIKPILNRNSTGLSGKLNPDNFEDYKSLMRLYLVTLNNHVTEQSTKNKQISADQINPKKLFKLITEGRYDNIISEAVNQLDDTMSDFIQRTKDVSTK